MEHLLDKPPIVAKARPNPAERMDRIVKQVAGTSLGVSEDNMAGFLFEQQSLGNLSHEDSLKIMEEVNDLTELGVQGAGAAAVGASADLTAFATTILYNTWNMAKGHDWAWPEDMRNVPATSDWWGARMGLSKEQTDSLAFIGGSLAIAPSRLDGLDQKTVSKALKTAKALGGGTRKAALAKRKEAMKLYRETQDADTVWQETGWWPETIDGKTTWKFYISDADAVFKEEALFQKAAQQAETVGLSSAGDRIQVSLTLADVLDHPALFELYPELAGYPIHIWVQKTNTRTGWTIPQNQGEALATWNPRSRQFALNSVQGQQRAMSARESLLHEAQHAIQTLEGWADGASQSAMEDAITRFKAGRFMSSIYNDPDAYMHWSEEDVIRFAVDELGFGEETAQVLLKEIDRTLSGDIDPDQLDYWKGLEKSGGDEAVRWLSTAQYMGDDQLKFIEDLPYKDARALAALRYYRDLGEMEARLVQALSNMDQKQIESVGVTPHNLMGLMKDERMLRFLRQMFPDMKQMVEPERIEDAITHRTVPGPREEVVQFPRHRTKAAQESREQTQKLDEAWVALKEAEAEYDSKWGQTPWLLMDSDPFYLRRVAFRQGVNPEKLLKEVKDDTARLDSMINDYNKMLEDVRVPF